MRQTDTVRETQGDGTTDLEMSNLGLMVFSSSRWRDTSTELSEGLSAALHLREDKTDGNRGTGRTAEQGARGRDDSMERGVG